MEKINIYVPNDIETKLKSDASMFEIYKNDGRTINMNRFLTLLIIGYYDDYVSEAESALKSIESALKTEKLSVKEKEFVANSILNEVILPSFPHRKGKSPKPLSLKPTKGSEVLIEHILNIDAAKEHTSQYFCRMFMSYCEKPFSKREQIIFKATYDALSMACATQRNVSFKTIWNPRIIHEVTPFRIAVGPEEMFNYLLCEETNPNTGKKEAKSYRLNRIAKVHIGRHKSSIEDTTLYYLNLMTKYGPQYMINDEEESCVRLTNSGRINFSRIYYGRPQVNRIEEGPEGYYYYFKCSKDQLFFYFRRFGYDDVEILSPPSLRQKMSDFHRMAYKTYQ